MRRKTGTLLSGVAAIAWGIMGVQLLTTGAADLSDGEGLGQFFGTLDIGAGVLMTVSALIVLILSALIFAGRSRSTIWVVVGDAIIAVLSALGLSIQVPVLLDYLAEPAPYWFSAVVAAVAALSATIGFVLLLISRPLRGAPAPGASDQS